jgi:hypothetical protein
MTSFSFQRVAARRMKERAMRRYLAPVLLPLATAAGPGMAGAVEFMDQTTAPPVGTTTDDFREVLGPEATEPEHAGDFVGPLPDTCHASRSPLHIVFRRGARPGVGWISTAGTATTAALIPYITA